MPAALMTEEQFRSALPAQFKKSVNSDLIDQINNTLASPEDARIYRDNLISYSSVLLEGKFKMSSYLDAVRYAGFKIMGHTNVDAYIKTFPDKHHKFIMDGVDSKTISSYIHAYNKSKLVNLILAQAMIPTHILNADLYQKALNKQFELMNTAQSEKVQTEAANSLLTHLKPPETKKVELDIGIKEDSAIRDLRATTRALAEQQMKMLKSGDMTAQEAAHSGIVVNAEFEEV